MKRSVLLYLRLSIILLPNIALAMVFDNRYLPLIQEPFITIDCRPSSVRTDLFVTTGNRANGNNSNYIGIPEMFGPFDLASLGQSFLVVGLPNLLSPTQLSSLLPFALEGKIQTQGVAFAYRQHIVPHFSAGLYTLLMQSNSSINYIFNASGSTLSTTPTEILNLDSLRRQMIQEEGLTCNHVHQSGIGDIEVYLRGNGHWEYVCKMRTVEAAGRFGVLIPTGQRKKINEPASIPFGGDGFWGVYVSGDAEFEIREDWKVGLLLRASKRFAQTRTERMPTAQEQPLFGVVVGQARINPGWTGVFSPYVSFENLRGGLGLRGQYTLISHQRDTWCDQRADRTIPVNLVPLERTSGWASEYVTLTGFYDFGKMKVERGREPTILLSWYIPTALIVANRSVRSYKVTVGVEYSF